MRFRQEVLLHCSADRLLAALARPELLRQLSAPMVVFEPVEPRRLPAVWTPGEHRFRLLIGGRLPIGLHTVDVVQLETSPAALTGAATQVWHDAGFSDLITRWDHRIELTEEQAGNIRYADVLDIRAGALTLPVWLFAQTFYAHRQRRLRRLVAAGRLG